MPERKQPEKEPNKIRTAVVPAAGKGTRMRPITYAVPKELLPLGSKPVIHWVLEELAGGGISDVVLVLSRDKTAVLDYLDRVADSSLPKNIRWVYQPEPRGLGDAVRCARNALEDAPFAVALGDCVIDSPKPGSAVGRLCEVAAQNNCSALLCEEVPRESVSKYGVLDPKEATRPVFKLRGVVEKPAADKAPSNLVIAARYVLNPAIFEYLDRTKADHTGEIQLTNAMSSMIRDGYTFFGVCLEPEEKRLDIGSHSSYFEAFETMVKRQTNA